MISASNQPGAKSLRKSVRRRAERMGTVPAFTRMATRICGGRFDYASLNGPSGGQELPLGDTTAQRWRTARHRPRAARLTRCSRPRGTRADRQDGRSSFSARTNGAMTQEVTSGRRSEAGGAICLLIKHHPQSGGTWKTMLDGGMARRTASGGWLPARAPARPKNCLLAVFAERMFILSEFSFPGTNRKYTGPEKGNS